MKQILLGTFLSATIALSVVPPAVHAVSTYSPQKAHAAYDDITYGDLIIEGYITRRGLPGTVAEATVSFRCHIYSEIIKSVTSDATGHYSISVTNKECPTIAEDMFITAIFGDWGGGQEFNGTPPHRHVDVALSRNVSIPEYGQIGGVLAGGAGLGTMIVIRRRLSRQV